MKKYLILAGVFCASVSHAVVFEVHIFNFGYSSNPTIQLGDTVKWIWDSGTHSTTAAAGQAENWNSGLHSPVFSFNKTFTHLGRFNYYCQLHGEDQGGGNVGGMSGFIRVVPEPASALALSVGALALLRRRRSK